MTYDPSDDENDYRIENAMNRLPNAVTEQYDLTECPTCEGDGVLLPCNDSAWSCHEGCCPHLARECESCKGKGELTTVEAAGAPLRGNL